MLTCSELLGRQVEYSLAAKNFTQTKRQGRYTTSIAEKIDIIENDNKESRDTNYNGLTNGAFADWGLSARILQRAMIKRNCSQSLDDFVYQLKLKS